MSSSSTASRLEALQGLIGAKSAVRGFSRPDSGAHAVLLYGLEGSGKRTLARELARAWLCKANTGEGACGVCQACQAFDRGNLSDFLKIVPEGKSGIIKLGQITEGDQPGDRAFVPLRSFLRTGPLLAKAKVVLIEQADRMNASAANALLKTLEEPEDYGKLILTTDSVGGVLPTILSRCVAVSCDLPVDRDPDVSEEAWALARGAPGKAKAIAANWDAYRDLLGLVDTLLTAKPHLALALSERFQEIAEKLEEDENAQKRQEQSEGLRALAEALRYRGAPPAWIHRVVRAHAWVSGNTNAPLVFDALFVNLLQSPSAGTEDAARR